LLHGYRHLFSQPHWIVSPKIIAEAKIHSYQAFFWSHVGPREQKCRVAGYLHIQPDVG
jgi:hypothetical protein